jgi:Tfp pilus assembly protein PilN
MKISGWSQSRSTLPISSLHLSLAPVMIQAVRVLQWVLCSMIVAAWGVSVWWWWTSQTLEEEAARYAVAAGRTEDLNRQFTAQMTKDQLTFSPQQMTVIKHEVAYINQLADKRAFSWTQLLSDLEKTLPPSVAIGKIQVDMKDSTVTFDGLAARMQDLNALMARLQTGPSFSRPLLHHHKHIESQKNSAPDPAPGGIEFSLTVIYRNHA